MSIFPSVGERLLMYTNAMTGDENETCKIPDRLLLPHGTGRGEAEIFRHRRW